MILPREEYLKQQEIKLEEGSNQPVITYKNLSELKLKHLKSLFKPKVQTKDGDDVKTEECESSVNGLQKTET